MSSYTLWTLFNIFFYIDVLYSERDMIVILIIFIIIRVK